MGFGGGGFQKKPNEWSWPIMEESNHEETGHAEQVYLSAQGLNHTSLGCYIGGRGPGRHFFFCEFRILKPQDGPGSRGKARTSGPVLRAEHVYLRRQGLNRASFGLDIWVPWSAGGRTVANPGISYPKMKTGHAPMESSPKNLNPNCRPGWLLLFFLEAGLTANACLKIWADAA